ncbi:hypothetical protein PPACK8108_LOCUS9206 [Phakopsora pachyrhizi]|uniref:Uncharacterized protein n=1 Tax=Phakopsora pachyrhizi TaxID=170000 RepID=A0AAV0AXZ9_PHAPC|nr:hypothetical protein PPACK8108_LOCUS9206 [Phakopsora pachyrhizi]
MKSSEPQSPLTKIPINPNQQNPLMASTSFLPSTPYLMGAGLPVPPHLAHLPQAPNQVSTQLYSETNHQSIKLNLLVLSLTHSPTPSGQEPQQMDQKAKKWVRFQQKKFGEKQVKTSFVDTSKQEMPPERCGEQNCTVQLSYDMIGYNGIKILVNKTLSKFIEQVDGGDLILNKGDKEKPKSKHSRNKEGRFLSNKGSEDEDHDGYQGLDLVLKLLERYQITLEKVGLQEFIKKHLTSPFPTTGSWMSFGSKILPILLRFLQMIIIPRDMRGAAEQGNVYLQVLMVCCGLQIVNWSWMLVRCNPKIEIWDGPRSGTGKVEGSGGFCAKDVVLARREAALFGLEKIGIRRNNSSRISCGSSRKSRKEESAKVVSVVDGILEIIRAKEKTGYKDRIRKGFKGLEQDKDNTRKKERTDRIQDKEDIGLQEKEAEKWSRTEEQSIVD